MRAKAIYSRSHSAEAAGRGEPIRCCSDTGCDCDSSVTSPRCTNTLRGPTLRRQCGEVPVRRSSTRTNGQDGAAVKRFAPRTSNGTRKMCAAPSISFIARLMNAAEHALAFLGTHSATRQHRSCSTQRKWSCVCRGASNPIRNNS